MTRPFMPDQESLRPRVCGSSTDLRPHRHQVQATPFHHHSRIRLIQTIELVCATPHAPPPTTSTSAIGERAQAYAQCSTTLHPRTQPHDTRFTFAWLAKYLLRYHSPLGAIYSIFIRERNLNLSFQFSPVPAFFLSP